MDGLHDNSGRISFTVNGEARELNCAPSMRLSEVLREALALRATKVGCNAGDCGACTVLLDGDPVCACLVPAGQVAGRAVETAESLAGEDRALSALQAAFLRHGAAQCGICTPGMMMAATALLRQDASPDRQAVEETVANARAGKFATAAVDVRLARSPDRVGQLYAARVDMGEGAGIVVYLIDATEQKSLELQFAQSQKMQAVGQLAGGVAHDFNNLLTAIIGFCDLLLARHQAGDPSFADVVQIKQNANRAANLTRQLLAFSRRQTLRPKVLSLTDALAELQNLLARLLTEKVELKIVHGRELGLVKVDQNQLEQVIINLAVNARDAMQANAHERGKQDWKGRLTLATRRVSARDVRKMGIDIMPADDYTVLIVQDTGGGIPEEHLNKIFEPFFTTKEQGKGTGLGLSTVYGIVKQSNGFIFADNVQGPDGAPIGARFTMYLPVHKGEMPADMRAEEPEETKATEWSAGGKLLLVEDEDMVRAVAERALVRAGYTVTTVTDGEEGLAEVANGSTEFDLIVSDVVMPVMDGPAMARAIRRVKPDIPILFMSGYAEEQLRNDIDIDNMHFIPKPFSVQQINSKVAEVLSGQRD